MLMGNGKSFRYIISSISLETMNVIRAKETLCFVDAPKLKYFAVDYCNGMILLNGYRIIFGRFFGQRIDRMVDLSKIKSN